MSRKKRDNWYDRKWSNKRARANRVRRAEKYRSEKTFETMRYVEETQNDVAQLQGIVSEIQRSYYVVIYDDQQIRCRLADVVISPEAEQLVIGDKVAFDLINTEEAEGQGLIKQVFPRKSRLVRMREDRTRRSEFAKEEHVLAANVDVVVIVASAASPPFHPRFIDRYLVMCQYGDVAPVICINKCDLVVDIPDLVIYQKMGIPVVYVSAVTGYGIESLREVLHGKYSVLTGHSGVGKSTIINILLGREVLRTSEVGRKKGRGRHTTSISTLHKVDDSTYLIDTPGIRSLGFWDVDKNSLRFYFPEFADHAPNCKFTDCTHTTEPECAVKIAVSQSGISTERYDSYLRMMREE